MNSKIMYLTFDDGPSVENTPRVLDILRDRNIKATFFLIGEYVERYPDIARRIVQEGHGVGVHCYKHDYDIIYKTVDSYIQDFEKAYWTIKRVTTAESKIFRFPGGSNKKICKDIAKEMKKRGFCYFDWNACLEDAVNDPVPKELIVNAIESSRGKNKVVMLAHDRVYATGICLNSILDQLTEFRMEVLTEDVEPIQFNIK